MEANEPLVFTMPVNIGKREFFAALMLQADIASSGSRSLTYGNGITYEEAVTKRTKREVKRAIRYADELITQLDTTPQP